jgi:hypothetical protein
MRTLPLCLGLSIAACATPPAPAPPLRVFETSTTYSGNLVAEAGDPALDGPHAGDLLCQRVADSAGLGGTWTAYLSVGTASDFPPDRLGRPGYDQDGRPHATYAVRAVDRLQGDGPWYDIAGKAVSSPMVVFQDRNDLLRGAFRNLITTETGVGQVAYAWTGTHNDGTPTSNDCAGWSMSKMPDFAPTPWGSVGIDDPQSDYVALFYDPYAADWYYTWSDLRALYPDPTIAKRDIVGLGAVNCTDPGSLYCFEDP